MSSDSQLDRSDRPHARRLPVVLLVALASVLVPPRSERTTRLRSSLSVRKPRTRTLVNVFFVVAILTAAGTAAYAVTVADDEPDSEFYLLAENEEGRLVADDYPREFTAGEPQQFVVGVRNQERRSTSYTVLVELQRVRTADGSTTVLETERLHRFEPRVRPGGTWRRAHAVEPTIVGERLRLTYLLYRGEPPRTPTTDNADRKLHLWVNVTASR